MKRLLFYILLSMAFCCRALKRRWYDKMIMSAHKTQGVKFIGNPDYIHTDAYLDPSGGLVIGQDVVISTRVVVLTHDWSFLKRDNCLKDDKLGAYRQVEIRSHSFIGAGAIILPGSVIGEHCIIGAGAVVKGHIPDFSIVVGNPAKIIGRTDR